MKKDTVYSNKTFLYLQSTSLTNLVSNYNNVKNRYNDLFSIKKKPKRHITTQVTLKSDFDQVQRMEYKCGNYASTHASQQMFQAHVAKNTAKSRRR